MKKINIIPTEGAEETFDILAKAITDIAEWFAKLQAWPLKQDTIIVLLQQQIGSANINKSQIRLVLEALPLLKSTYIKKTA